MKFEIHPKVTVNQDMIESLIVSAFEGGSNYWYRIESDTKRDYLKTALDTGLIVSDFQIEGKITKKGRLNKSSMKKALNLMAEKYPHHFSDVVSENTDAITGDVFLQLAVFGEIIYG